MDEEISNGGSADNSRIFVGAFNNDCGTAKITEKAKAIVEYIGKNYGTFLG